MLPLLTYSGPLPCSAKPIASVAIIPAIEKQSCASTVPICSFVIFARSNANFTANSVVNNLVGSSGCVVISSSACAKLTISTVSFKSRLHLFNPYSDIIARDDAASETFEQSNTVKLSTNVFPFGSIEAVFSKSVSVL